MSAKQIAEQMKSSSDYFDEKAKSKLNNPLGDFNPFLFNAAKNTNPQTMAGYLLGRVLSTPFHDWVDGLWNAKRKGVTETDTTTSVTVNPVQGNPDMFNNAWQQHINNLIDEGQLRKRDDDRLVIGSDYAETTPSEWERKRDIANYFPGSYFGG